MSRTVAFLIDQNEGIRETTFIYARLKLKLNSPGGREKKNINDLGLFYSSCIRSIMDYAVPVFHYSLPKYLMRELEHVHHLSWS